jgi:hypothetical protein
MPSKHLALWDFTGLLPDGQRFDGRAPASSRDELLTFLRELDVLVLQAAEVGADAVLYRWRPCHRI